MSETTEALIERVLGAHEASTHYGDLEGCTCDRWSRPWGEDGWDEYRAHVAAAIAEALAGWMTAQRDDLAVIIATLSGGTHEPEAHDGDGDDWTIEADEVLRFLTNKEIR